MSLRQQLTRALRSFGKWSRGDQATPVLPASPAPLPPELKDREFIIPLFTGEGREPLVISGQKFELGDSWGKDSARIIINVAGARHPYDEGFKYNYFGREIMNPALVPALDKIKDVLEQSIIAQCQDKSLDGKMRASLMTSNPTTKPNMDGQELWLTFNDQGQKVSPAAVDKVYTTLQRALEKSTPDFRRILDDNKHLQPPLKPTHEDRLAFDLKVQDAWHSAAARAGIKRNQLRNGTGFNAPFPD